MTVSYRNKFNAYKQEHEQNYASIGSILSFPVDSYSDTSPVGGGAGSGSQIPEYSYNGYLYCDGRTLLIRDYPQLYSAITTTYGGTTSVTREDSGQDGGLRRIFWIGNKCFFTFYRDTGVNASVQLPYPYGFNFRFVDDTGSTPAGPGLGSVPSAFGYNTFYGTKLPTETLTVAQVPVGEFAYEVVFPDGVDPATLPKSDVVITNNIHPSIVISKAFTFADTPYQIGTFDLPDYRDRVIVGVGSVDGEGTPTVENALINTVGQTGGAWYISKDELLDGGTFFAIGDVRTRGYTEISADVFSYITGSVDFRVGPLDDFIFSRPVEHNHYILSSEPDTIVDNEREGVPVDEFAVNYTRTRANIQAFEPAGGGGLALGHSHGLTREALNDASTATFGNTAGIGGIDPNQPADIFYDVNGAEWNTFLHPLGDGRIGYDDISLEPHGPGTGEWEGFLKPSIAQGNRYLAFGYGASATGFSNPEELKTSRRVELELDFTGYTQLYVFAIAGNDNNGGERPNNVGEGLYCEFQGTGETLRLFPSVQDYRNENGLDNQEAFDLYDAIHSNWKEFIIDIPASLQDQPNQVIVLKQNLQGGVEQDNVPAGNENANDMLGVQGVGLRGGILQEPPEPDGCYPITSSPNVDIIALTYTAGNGYALANTADAHGFEKGDFVTVAGAIPDQYNGTFEIIDDEFASNSFAYVPDTAPSVSPAVTGGSGQVITVKLAAGTFEDVTTTPAPRLYPIDNSTQIGGKVDVDELPGVGTVFQDDSLDSAGSFTLNPVPQSSGNVTRIDIELQAPGGGGAGSTGDGGNGGYAYFNIDVGGTSYTVYAYGGQGGTAGGSGGGGGGGGTFLVPSELAALSNVTITTNPGTNGSSGGATGPGQAAGGGNIGAQGSGGYGQAGTFTTTTDSGFQTQGGTSWTAPSSGGNLVGRTVSVRVAGGGGGGGNSNGNSGCAGTGAIGGVGGGGALITGTFNGNGPATLTWQTGGGGSAGFNNVDANVSGTGGEAGSGPGGGGSAGGGLGGTGAWGNGATAGAGGGCTGLFYNGTIACLGAGGGGGGGGSGGGFNGGGTTDGCYAGGNNRSATTNLVGQSNALDFDTGSNGTGAGCTAGGGGGGGAGAGPNGGANGGDGGQAGVGHNGNGGGSGGRRGQSAFRDNLMTATYSTASNGGSPGSAGGSGYVQIRVQDTTEQYANVGGGGGEGAQIFFEITGVNTTVTAGLQNAGSSGGDGSQSGNQGYVIVRYRGTTPGETVEGTVTTPVGGYYECDLQGVPAGAKLDGAVWKSSSANGDPEYAELVPLDPGNGTGPVGKFQMSTSAAGDPATYGGRATKYLPFTGPGTREYIIGNLDLRNVNKIQFSAIRGTNFNGGAAPEEDLLLYWRKQGSATTTLLNSVLSQSSGSGNWEEVDIILADGSDVRDNNIELILRQTRVLTQDDNASFTEDNYGISAMTLFYSEVTTREFTPSNGTTICDIDFVDRTVTTAESGMISSEGTFEMSSSTPISVTADAIPESNIPLITKYHRVKYLIKAV